MFAKNIFAFKFVKIYCIHEISYWIIAPRSLRNTDWQKSVVNFELNFCLCAHCSLHGGVKTNFPGLQPAIECGEIFVERRAGRNASEISGVPFNANICLLLKIYFSVRMAWLDYLPTLNTWDRSSIPARERECEEFVPVLVGSNPSYE